MAGVNRIGGDWSAEALEAFRSAYGQQLMTVEDQDVDDRTGLPTNTISNTSPWIEHTGIWKYPSGRGPDDELQKPFNVDQYLSQELSEDEEDESMSEEEVEKLLSEMIQEEEEEEE